MTQKNHRTIDEISESVFKMEEELEKLRSEAMQLLCVLSKGFSRKKSWNTMRPRPEMVDIFPKDSIFAGTINGSPLPQSVNYYARTPLIDSYDDDMSSLVDSNDDED